MAATDEFTTPLPSASSPVAFSSVPDPSSDPTNPTTIQLLPLFPVAAILVIVVVVFLSVIVTLLLIRKVLKNKGITGGGCPQCCNGDVLPSCRLNCLEVAEKMDCSIPSCHVWLDNICPTKQQCSMTCSRIWSCYCCLAVAGACDGVEVCPSCSAMECPDYSCCGDCCHCTLKVPECSQVTCLCFECGKAS